MGLRATTGIDHTALKVGSAWATVLIAELGFQSWSEIAAFAAALYTACLLGEWVWKKALRPLLERYKILPKRLRRHTDRPQ